MLNEWNDRIEFNLIDLESFSLQKEIARSIIHQAIQYIVSALNSALMQNVDYHLSSITDTYFDVK